MPVVRVLKVGALLALSVLMLGCAGQTTTTIVPTSVPPAPTATPLLGLPTPGPQAQHIKDVTSTDDCNPHHATPPLVTHFTVGARVCVSATVTSSTDKDVLTAYWFLNGSLVQIATYKFALPGDGSRRVVFIMPYPVKGVGVAKLYWDASDGANDRLPSDQFLAYSIAFAVG